MHVTAKEKLVSINVSECDTITSTFISTNIGTLLTGKSFIIIFDNVTITSTAKGINIGSVLLWSLCITGNKIAISKLKRGTSKQKH